MQNGSFLIHRQTPGQAQRQLIFRNEGRVLRTENRVFRIKGRILFGRARLRDRIPVLDRELQRPAVVARAVSGRSVLQQQLHHTWPGRNQAITIVRGKLEERAACYACTFPWPPTSRNCQCTNAQNVSFAQKRTVRKEGCAQIMRKTRMHVHVVRVRTKHQGVLAKAPRRSRKGLKPSLA